MGLFPFRRHEHVDWFQVRPCLLRRKYPRNIALPLRRRIVPRPIRLVHCHGRIHAEIPVDSTSPNRVTSWQNRSVKVGIHEDGAV